MTHFPSAASGRNAAQPKRPPQAELPLLLSSQRIGTNPADRLEFTETGWAIPRYQSARGHLVPSDPASDSRGNDSISANSSSSMGAFNRYLKDPANRSQAQLAELALGNEVALLKPQRFYRVHLRRPPGRDYTGRCGYRDQYQRRNREGDRISRADFEQQARQIAA